MMGWRSRRKKRRKLSSGVELYGANESKLYVQKFTGPFGDENYEAAILGFFYRFVWPLFIGYEPTIAHSGFTNDNGKFYYTPFNSK